MTAPPWRCPYCRAKPNEPCWSGKRGNAVEPHAARRDPPKVKWRNLNPVPVDEQSARAIETLPTGMWSRTEFTTGCWNWHGAKTSAGYGSFSYGGRARSTHRLAYELLVGPIPLGLQLDHLCENQLCCRPGHLEPVTMQENMRRRHADPDRANARLQRQILERHHPCSGSAPTRDRTWDLRIKSHWDMVD